MSPLFAVELNSDHVFVLTIISIGVLVPIVAIIANVARAAVIGREREQSRRELAAYVAEGSMTADEAERLMQAAPPRRCTINGRIGHRVHPSHAD